MSLQSNASKKARAVLRDRCGLPRILDPHVRRASVVLCFGLISHCRNIGKPFVQSVESVWSWSPSNARQMLLDKNACRIKDPRNILASHLPSRVAYRTATSRSADAVTMDATRGAPAELDLHQEQSKLIADLGQRNSVPQIQVRRPSLRSRAQMKGRVCQFLSAFPRERERRAA